MDEKELAIKAVREGGKILSDNFKGDYGIKRKAKHDFVTDIDLKVEKEILGILEESEYSVLGEETGLHKQEGEKKWIVDPLDGTTNFILNMPLFSSAIALTEGNVILVSAVYMPITGDLVVAEKGKGAYLNEEELEVSDKDELDDSFLIFCHGKRPVDSQNAVKVYEKFKTKCNDLRQLGSASVEFTTVAMGRAEAFLNPGIPSYDAAPGVLILKEAGGKVTDFKGKNWTFSKDNLVASNGSIHDKIIKRSKDLL